MRHIRSQWVNRKEQERKKRAELRRYKAFKGKPQLCESQGSCCSRNAEADSQYEMDTRNSESQFVERENCYYQQLGTDDGNSLNGIHRHPSANKFKTENDQEYWRDTTVPQCTTSHMNDSVIPDYAEYVRGRFDPCQRNYEKIKVEQTDSHLHSFDNRSGREIANAQYDIGQIPGENMTLFTDKFQHKTVNPTHKRKFSDVDKGFREHKCNPEHFTRWIRKPAQGESYHVKHEHDLLQGFALSSDIYDRNMNCNYPDADACFTIKILNDFEKTTLDVDNTRQTADRSSSSYPLSVDRTMLKYPYSARFTSSECSPKHPIFPTHHCYQATSCCGPQSSLLSQQVPQFIPQIEHLPQLQCTYQVQAFSQYPLLRPQYQGSHTSNLVPRQSCLSGRNILYQEDVGVSLIENVKPSLHNRCKLLIDQSERQAEQFPDNKACDFGYSYKSHQGSGVERRGILNSRFESDEDSNEMKVFLTEDGNSINDCDSTYGFLHPTNERSQNLKTAGTDNICDLNTSSTWNRTQQKALKENTQPVDRNQHAQKHRRGHYAEFIRRNCEFPKRKVDIKLKEKTKCSKSKRYHKKINCYKLGKHTLAKEREMFRPWIWQSPDMDDGQTELHIGPGETDVHNGKSSREPDLNSSEQSIEKEHLDLKSGIKSVLDNMKHEGVVYVEHGKMASGNDIVEKLDKSEKGLCTFSGRETLFSGQHTYSLQENKNPQLPSQTKDIESQAFNCNPDKNCERCTANRLNGNVCINSVDYLEMEQLYKGNHRNQTIGDLKQPNPAIKTCTSALSRLPFPTADNSLKNLSSFPKPSVRDCMQKEWEEHIVKMQKKSVSDKETNNQSKMLKKYVITQRKKSWTMSAMKRKSNITKKRTMDELVKLDMRYRKMCKRAKGSSNNNQGDSKSAGMNAHTNLQHEQLKHECVWETDLGEELVGTSSPVGNSCNEMLEEIKHNTHGRHTYGQPMPMSFVSTIEEHNYFEKAKPSKTSRDNNLDKINCVKGAVSQYESGQEKNIAISNSASKQINTLPETKPSPLKETEANTKDKNSPFDSENNLQTVDKPLPCVEPSCTVCKTRPFTHSCIDGPIASAIYFNKKGHESTSEMIDAKEGSLTHYEDSLKNIGDKPSPDTSVSSIRRSNRELPNSSDSSMSDKQVLSTIAKCPKLKILLPDKRNESLVCEDFDLVDVDEIDMNNNKNTNELSSSKTMTDITNSHIESPEVIMPLIDTKTAVNSPLSMSSYTLDEDSTDIEYIKNRSALSPKYFSEQSKPLKNPHYEKGFGHFDAQKGNNFIESKRPCLSLFPTLAPDPFEYTKPKDFGKEYGACEGKDNGSRCLNNESYEYFHSKRYSPTQEDFEMYKLERQRFCEFNLQSQPYSHLDQNLVSQCCKRSPPFDNNNGTVSFVENTTARIIGSNPSELGAAAFASVCDTAKPIDEMMDVVGSTDMFDTTDDNGIEKVIEDVVSKDYLDTDSAPDLDSDFIWLDDNTAEDSIHIETGTLGDVQTKHEKNDTGSLLDYTGQNRANHPKRCPVRLSSWRKHRYCKRFPMGLARMKRGRYMPEKALYESAVEFLGDFDKNSKRRTCRISKQLELDESFENKEHDGVKVKQENEYKTQKKEKPLVNPEKSIGTAKEEKSTNITGRQKESVAMKLEILAREKQRRQKLKDSTADKVKPFKSHTENDEANKYSGILWEVSDAKTLYKTKDTDDVESEKVLKLNMADLLSKSKYSKPLVGKGKLLCMREHFDKKSRTKLKKNDAKGIVWNKTPYIKMEKMRSDGKLEGSSKEIDPNKEKCSTSDSTSVVFNKTQYMKVKKMNSGRKFQKGRKDTDLNKKQCAPKDMVSDKSPHMKTNKFNGGKKLQKARKETYLNKKQCTSKDSDSRECNKKHYMKKRLKSDKNLKKEGKETKENNEKCKQTPLFTENFKPCQICGVMLNEKISTLQRHFSKCHETWCFRCQKDLKDQQLLGRHRKRNHDIPTFCGLCGVSFLYKYNYTVHCQSPSHMEKLKTSTFVGSGGLVRNRNELSNSEIISISSDHSSDEFVHYISSCSEDVFTSPERTVQEIFSSPERNIRYVKENVRELPSASNSIKESSEGTYGKKAKAPEGQPFNRKKCSRNGETQVYVKKKKDKQLKFCNYCKKSYKVWYAHIGTEKHLFNVKLHKKNLNLKRIEKCKEISKQSK